MIEIAIPLKVLPSPVSFTVRVERELGGTRTAIEQHPLHGSIFLDVPTSAFSAQHWRA